MSESDSVAGGDADRQNRVTTAYVHLAHFSGVLGDGQQESGSSSASGQQFQCSPDPPTILQLNAKDLKKTVRISDWSLKCAVRRHLWRTLCSRLSTWCVADADEYRETVTQLEGEYAAVSACKHQTAEFVSAFYSRSHHSLSELGRACVARVLAVIQYCQPTITYCPSIYSICALFLHYLPEEDVYCCLNALLKSREPAFLIQTRREFETWWRTFITLSNKHVRSSVRFLRHFVTTDDKMADVMSDWVAWIFCFLPLTHVSRIVDCYLVEGEKVLYRAAMALIKLLHQAAGDRRNLRWKNLLESQPLNEVLETFCREIPFPVCKLLKTMFQMKALSRTSIRSSYASIRVKLREHGGRLTFPERSDMRDIGHHNNTGGVPPLAAQQNLADGSGTINIKELIGKYPQLRISPSQLLTPQDLLLLWEHIPQRFALCTPTLLFTSNEHGFSLKTFYARVSSHEPTVLLLRTTTGAVIGAFCTTNWNTRNQLQEDGSRFTYFGTGEMFIFTLRPEFHIYPWVVKRRQRENPFLKGVTHAEQLFMAASNTMITVGGGGSGQAIWLDENLARGKSDSCATFDNPPLVPGGVFTVSCMEALGFVPP